MQDPSDRVDKVEASVIFYLKSTALDEQVDTFKKAILSSMAGVYVGDAAAVMEAVAYVDAAQ